MRQTAKNLTTPKAWDAINPETRAAMLEWFNRSQPDNDDLELLAELHANKRFKWWECPACGDEVYEGDPEDWGEFQGVMQNDRTSYPGKGPRDKRCDHCRCHDKH